MGGAATARRRPSLSAVAALVRVPNLFTAPPDVILGAALAAGAGSGVAPRTVAGLALASVFLYAGGTALNDAFDALRDADERPERPIPSGEISRRTGFELGALFLVLGVATAGASAGLAGGTIAAATAAGILLYDGALNGGTFGFLAMGAVRGLNVVLGTAAGEGLLPPRWYLPVVAIAVYIAAVTFMAADEARDGNRSAVAVAAVATIAAALTAGVHLGLARAGPAAAAVGLGLAGWFLIRTGAALRAAYADPSPSTVGPAVGTCVLGLVAVDAAYAAASGLVWAGAAVAFLVPAVWLARLFDVS
ncbi:UbiA family prenyltransferase [Halostella sp. JP-L12]|uniref:UbiA family prenyltransferase n=1 Tax=Halostella TaxID=1843185 RepID=UPI000EF81A13|nr:MULTISPECIES: UbiA family prenyltransferase [Halostella]NHN49409.1 UbiA family prenyltransferase [Halostella sp. JP-L12]